RGRARRGGDPELPRAGVARDERAVLGGHGCRRTGDCGWEDRGADRARTGSDAESGCRALACARRRAVLRRVMRAAVYRSDGVISVEDIDDPAPGPGEVRVRVHVSGVNPTDWKVRAAGAEFQVPNQDGAGVIESVGPGVDASRVGERVWIYFAAWQRRWGTAAEYCVVPSSQAVAFGGSFCVGAAVGMPGPD